jgi:hypothetical protein
LPDQHDAFENMTRRTSGHRLLWTYSNLISSGVQANSLSIFECDDIEASLRGGTRAPLDFVLSKHQFRGPSDSGGR